jgi:hypothetical protein
MAAAARTLHVSAPVEDPADWDAATFSGRSAFARELTPAEVAELGAICDSLQQRGLGWNDTARGEFPFEALAPRLEQVLHELGRGCGFALLRGLPLGRWSKDKARLATWGIGTWMGQHVSQTGQGLRLVDVSDVTGKEPSPRQYRTSQELRLHTDPASDIIGLACVQDAKAGGESVITSAVAVHNAMLAQRPDLLQLLYEGFHWHRFGEGRPEDGAHTRDRVPVFAQEAGQLSCRYVRSPIAAGHKEAGVPLTDAQVEALDLLDKLCASPRMRLALRMQPGDLLLVNNLAVLHARTQFEDHADLDKRRHMVRLWLEGFEGFRAVPRQLNFFNGGRCGIPPQAGQEASYDMKALYQDRASGGVAKLGL